MQKSGNFPSSLIVSGVSVIGTMPVIGGGFADIWQGEVKGTLVALKVLRIFGQTEDRIVAFNVSQNLVVNLLSDLAVGALSRSYDMAILHEHKCLSILWRMHRRVRSSDRSCISLVSEWKSGKLSEIEPACRQETIGSC